MQIREHTIMGTYLETRLVLSEREHQAVLRALAIIDEARDRITTHQGTDDHEWYGMNAMDLEGGMVSWID